MNDFTARTARKEAEMEERYPYENCVAIYPISEIYAAKAQEEAERVGGVVVVVRGRREIHKVD